MKKLLLMAMSSLLILTGILVGKTLQLTSQNTTKNTQKPLHSEFPKATEHLSRAIQFKTRLSTQDEQEFKDFHAYLKRTYPNVFKHLEATPINQSLVLKWSGSKKELKPALILSHLDVVPIASPKNWKVPPFEGKVDNTHIWGRGTLDDKGSVIAILESINTLLSRGKTPQRTLFFAFGEDEEIGGAKGAAQIAKYFESKNIRFEFAFDEGLAIIPGSMIGLKKPVALIGISEKGYQTVELEAITKGGHSSMPPSETAVTILSKALIALEQNPMPARLTSAAQEMFKTLAPHMGFGKKLPLANLWLFEPILLNQLAKKKSTNALIRTTMAPTMLQGSPKENVLASSAKATINLRVLPGDTLEGIKAHFKSVVSDPRIKIHFLSNRFPEAAKESDIKTQGFEAIKSSISEVYPEAHVAPSLVLATTDSRNYEHLCQDMYRFLPVYFSEEDLTRVHGSNERISKESYLRSLQFYVQFLSRL